MAAVFLAFLAVAAAMLAGREAVRVARFAAAGANTGAMVGLVLLVAVAACAAAAWLAGTFAPLLSTGHQAWFVAVALVLAALEVIFLDAPAKPREPTRSFGALALVLFAGVLADASGLIVISLAVATGEPALAAIGGALGAGGVLVAAALAGEDWERLPRTALRWAVGIALLGAAALIAFSPPSALS